MLTSAPAVRRAYLEPSWRAVHSSTRLLQSSSSITPVNHSSRPQQSCTIIVLRSQPFSTTPTHNSTRRSRRVHREALERVNATLTGRVPAFTGSPPTASPTALRLAAKARLERNKEPPPEFLDYEPQKNKPSSVFFWSNEANEMDMKLMARGNYPPPLPKFKHEENQQISKCHPSVWLASAHHLQMMHEAYDRLAFMGDAVAGKSISDLLLNDYYCIAGIMGLLKARLISNAQFAYFSRIYNIPCKNNENAQGDAFEALAGALYLDGKRDGVDIDRIIYNWLKELVEPWLELYIDQLAPTHKERVVSLHRAVPIAIAVATSNNPNSNQVMLAWESNIATQMIERRLKRGPQDDRNLLQAAVAQTALENSTVGTVGTVGTSYETPRMLEGAEKEELVKDEEEVMEEEEPVEEEEEEDLVTEGDDVEDVKKQQDTAAATGKAWPTAKTKATEALRRVEKARIRAETEVLRKANEERRQREMERRRDAEEKEAARALAEQKRLEELARQREESRRLEILRLEERLRKELAGARKEAEEAKKKADKEAEIARKKLEENRPITKGEKRAEKKKAKLEAEMARLEAKKRQLGVESKEAEEAAEKERLEKEKAEQEKVEKEKAEKEKAEKEKAEKEKADKEKAERERAEKERAEKERAEKEKAEKVKAEKEKARKEKAEKEKAEKEKAEKEKAEKEKAEKQKAEKEKAEKEKAEKEKARRIEKEKAEMEKAEKEKARVAEKERVEKERVEKERVEKERVEKERAEKERVEKERVEKEKAEKEKPKEKEKPEKGAEKVREKATYTPPPWLKPAAPTTPTPAAPIPPAPAPTPPPPPPPPPPPKPSLARIEALIAEKEAARAAKLKEEEEALKYQRLLHDIHEMEALVVKRREQTFKNSPYMTDEQKKEFAQGWAQYALMQREKMEKDAGVEVGSTLAHVKPEPVAEEKEEESTGFFGKLFGAFRKK